ncbi:Peptidyl-prolyl cis-trans isomerase, mitochondrial [Golovinomyces cichoracearum]|uniref:Peptidyl-prolyl cis-trans isomerase n=1 Tax=Golovinomyces cichoracearum TaxID=62708 RepID=A0A420H6S0_9PEZI|nr:Peptidyl-prolyl cis-trans isomerase, mitochondrial [Golovinomyces cichoracearum]
MAIKVFLKIAWTEKATDAGSDDQNPLTTDHVGTIRLNLFSEVSPITAENFRCLCTGEKGFGYLNSYIYRIIPNFMILAGDITANNGTGGHSIYGDNFRDECLGLISHNKPGILSMNNTGPNSNNSQFFITTSSTTWLNRKYVAFGEVADPESMSFVRQLERLGSLPNGDITVNPHPIIIECGEIK